MMLAKGTASIRTVDDWFKFAPPKGRERHWKDGRSAKEIARAWCAGPDGPCAPQEFAKLLSPLVTVEQIAAAEGWPEYPVPIDDLVGEPPNIDLALVSDGVLGKTAICVEAKADESFGEDVFTILMSAAVRIARDERTGAIARLQSLAARLLPEWKPGLPHLADIRYQLLTGTAAVLALDKVKEAKTAVFVVHEFAFAGSVDPRKQQRNSHDLDEFIRRMTGGSHGSLSDGELIGPIRVPLAADWGDVTLYVGKVTSHGRGEA